MEENLPPVHLPDKENKKHYQYTWQNSLKGLHCCIPIWHLQSKRNEIFNRKYENHKKDKRLKERF
jgi:hypothetical protein